MTAFDRRQFLRLNAAALAGAALAPVAAAGKKPGPGEGAPRGSAPIGPPESSPGFYRFTLGDMEVTVLSDGHFHFPMELVAGDIEPLEFLAYNVEPEQREDYFEARLVPSDHVPLQMNPVLIDTGRRRVLVDSGFGGGEGLPPTAGRLGATLEAAGAPPESVDTVILTHAHPDHLGGLLDPATGTPVFPDAEVVLAEAELAFWSGDDPVAVYEPLIELELVLGPARGVLGALDDRLRTVGKEEEVVPGIRSIPSPGHTPGHICLGVEGGGHELLLVGDAVVYPHVSFERPEWQVFIDADRELTGRTRRRLLDRAATDKMLILGFHFPFPGLGYALEYGDAYRWHPAGWNVLS